MLSSDAVISCVAEAILAEASLFLTLILESLGDDLPEFIYGISAC